MSGIWTMWRYGTSVLDKPQSSFDNLKGENMREELLLLVDEKDKVVGYGEKMVIHRKGQLHRAFSVFIIDLNGDRMLLQRRAFEKYHSGGLWSNACCSHPRKGEGLKMAVIRRIKEELGIDLDYIDSKLLRELGKFEYYKKFDKYAEHEIDYVFLIVVKSKEIILTPDNKEVLESKWIGIPELMEWLKERPNDFTAWFPKAFNIVLNDIYKLN